MESVIRQVAFLLPEYRGNCVYLGYRTATLYLKRPALYYRGDIELVFLFFFFGEEVRRENERVRRGSNENLIFKKKRKGKGIYVAWRDKTRREA